MRFLSERPINLTSFFTSKAGYYGHSLASSSLLYRVILGNNQN